MNVERGIYNCYLLDSELGVRKKSVHVGRWYCSISLKCRYKRAHTHTRSLRVDWLLRPNFHCSRTAQSASQNHGSDNTEGLTKLNASAEYLHRHASIQQTHRLGWRRILQSNPKMYNSLLVLVVASSQLLLFSFGFRAAFSVCDARVFVYIATAHCFVATSICIWQTRRMPVGRCWMDGCVCVWQND